MASPDRVAMLTHSWYLSRYAIVDDQIIPQGVGVSGVEGLDAELICPSKPGGRQKMKYRIKLLENE